MPSNLIDYQPEKVKNRVNEILLRYERMKESKERVSMDSRFSWEDAEKLWRFFSDKPTGEDEWRTDSVDGWVAATIKTAIAAVLSLNPTRQFRPRKKQYNLEKAFQLQEISDYIDEKGDWDIERYFIYLDALRLGKGFGETIYLKDTRQVKDVDTNKTITVTDYDDVISRRVSPYFFFVDEMATSMKDARDCIKREILSEEDFHRIYDKTYPIARGLKDFGNPSIPDESIETIINWHRPTTLQSNQVEILHYWSKPDGYEILANGWGIRIKKPNPYAHKQLPFFELPFSPLSADEFWCLGVPHIIWKDVNNLVSLQKMRIDREKLNIFRPFIFNALENFNKKLLKLEPLTGIPVRDTNNFKDFQFGDVPRSAFVEVEHIEQNLKRKTGIDERILGISGDTRITATEASFLREAAMKRLAEFLFFIRRIMLTREGKLKYELVKQYWKNPLRVEKVTTTDNMSVDKSVYRSVVKKVGEGFFDTYDVSPELFDTDYDVIIDPMSVQPQSKAMEQVRWGTLLVQTVPLVQGQLVNVDVEKIYTRYLNTFDENIENFRKGNDVQPSIFLAEKENEILANGKEITPTPANFVIREHLSKHYETFSRLKDMGELSESAQKVFVSHIQDDIKTFATAARAKEIAPQQNVKVPSPEEIHPMGSTPEASEIKQESGSMGEAGNMFQRTPQTIV